MQDIYCKVFELAVTNMEVAKTAASFLPYDKGNSKQSALFYYSCDR